MFTHLVLSHADRLSFITAFTFTLHCPLSVHAILLKP
jgi:hypothetical protein